MFYVRLGVNLQRILEMLFLSIETPKSVTNTWDVVQLEFVRRNQKSNFGG